MTVDEGGGYYDSGYIQPLDFFGDGTRIPLTMVSPYTSAGHISQTYTDHVSILKFIERTGTSEPSQNAAATTYPTPTPAKANASALADSSERIGHFVHGRNL